MLLPDLATGTIGPHGLAPRLLAFAPSCLHSCSLLPSGLASASPLGTTPSAAAPPPVKSLYSLPLYMGLGLWISQDSKNLAFDLKHIGLSLTPRSMGQIRISLRLSDVFLVSSKYSLNSYTLQRSEGEKPIQYIQVVRGRSKAYSKPG